MSLTPVHRPDRLRRRSRSAVIGAALALALALLALPAVASATVFSGAGQDPRNDQTTGGAAADIVAFSASYDDAGAITGQLTLAGALPASSSAFAFIFVGTTQADGSCQVAYGVGDTLATTGSNPLWGTPETPDMGAGTRSTPAADTIALSASAPALAGGHFTCAFASTSGDRTDPVPLSPPAPTPTPTPVPPAATPAPTPPPPPPARLGLSATVPSTVAKNHWTTINVTVANTGGIDATGVRLRLTAPANVRVTPSSKRIARLAAGRSIAVRVRVRPSGAARAGTKLTVVASAGGVATARKAVALPVRRPGPALELSIPRVAPLAPRAATTVRVGIRNTGTAAARKLRLRVRVSGATVRPASRRLSSLAAGRSKTIALRVTRRGSATPTLRFMLTGKGVRTISRTVKIAAPAADAPGAPPAATGPLAQRVYLRLITGTLGISQDRRVGYTFTDATWVYRGTPEGGIPSCTAKTAGVDERGDPTDGCLPYTYDAKTGALTIDGRPATLSDNGMTLTVGDEAFLFKPTFAPGARLNVTLKNIEVYGLFPNQSVFTSWITLSPDGQFAFSGSALGSLGSGDPSTWSSTISPDKRGTYEIVAGSAIQFSYADGQSARRTILIDGTPETEGATLDPQQEGLLLDGTAYWSS